MQTFLTPDGLKVAYHVDDFTDPWTKPDTLLLLHSAMGSSLRFYRWIPRLARKFRVVRIDMRGHGASQIPPADAPFSLAQLVADAVGILDRLGVASAQVVGNSAGGYVAQQLAINHPERVRTLALFGSTPGLKQSRAPTWIPRIKEIGLRKFLADTIDDRFDKNADPRLVEWFLDQAGGNEPEFTARFILHMCTHDFMDSVSRIACPTLIVASGHEPIGSSGAYRTMTERIRGSELVFVDTTGHNICDAYPDRCMDELLGFYRRNGVVKGT